MIQFSPKELDTTIILVENISHMARIIREMLKSLGFRHVVRVTNVIHAYQAVVRQPPGLIIAEVDIEPCGGARLCKALRIAADSPNRHIPIVLTITTPTPQSVSQARDSGAQFVLAKPFPVTGLATKIAAVLRNPQQFVEGGTYTGPERRRRAQSFLGEDRRLGETRTAHYKHAANLILDVGASVLAGEVPVPPEIVLEDNERVLRNNAALAGAGRKIMVTQLEEGMELAESIKAPDRSVLVPGGLLVTNAVMAALCRLVEQGKIGPLVRVMG